MIAAVDAGGGVVDEVGRMVCWGVDSWGKSGRSGSKDREAQAVTSGTEEPSFRTLNEEGGGGGGGGAGAGPLDLALLLVPSWLDLTKKGTRLRD